MLFAALPALGLVWPVLSVLEMVRLGFAGPTMSTLAARAGLGMMACVLHGALAASWAQQLQQAGSWARHMTHIAAPPVWLAGAAM